VSTARARRQRFGDGQEALLAAWERLALDLGDDLVEKLILAMRKPDYGAAATVAANAARHLATIGKTHP
jgi:hypothetical protein